MSEAFTKKFGRAGDAIADALRLFSLDVVGIVCGYACGVGYGEKPTLLFTFGSKGEAPGQFVGGCYSIACSPADASIWVGHSRGVNRYDREGRFLCAVAKEALFGWVCGIAFDSNGEVFISASDKHYIVVCDLEGKFIRKMGQFHTDLRSPASTLSLNYPMGLVADGDGLIYLVDSNNYRVQIIRRDGSRILIFGDRGEKEFDDTHGLALTDDKTLIFGDRGNDRVLLYTTEGKLIKRIGGPDQFSRPCDIAIDRYGDVLVSDQGNHRIAVYSPAPECAFLTSFDGFSSPHGLCVDNEGRILVGDERCRVSVFAFESLRY